MTFPYEVSIPLVKQVQGNENLAPTGSFTAGFLDGAKIEQLANIFTDSDVRLPDV